MARHAFDPLSPRVAAFEVAAGFVAAAAVGIAAEFSSDATTPAWLPPALFLGGLALWAGAVGWLFFAHRRMAEQAHDGPAATGGSGVTSPVWGALGAGGMAVLLVGIVACFILAARPDPDLTSAYDGQDPNAADCVDAAVTTPVGADGPVLSGLDGRPVGHLELRASPKCGTTWGKVIFDPAAAPGLRGRLLMLVMHRPADGAQVTYPLRLKGGLEGFSNMISSTAACVRAEAYFVDGDRRGPRTTTGCIEESW